jgi:hypothetical protein
MASQLLIKVKLLASAAFHAWMALFEWARCQWTRHARKDPNASQDIYVYIYTHTQEKLGELMGPSEREWSLLREEEDEEATQQERDSGLQVGHQKGVPGFEKSHDFAWGDSEQELGHAALVTDAWDHACHFCVCAMLSKGQDSLPAYLGHEAENKNHTLLLLSRKGDRWVFFYCASLCKNIIVVYTS